MALSPSLQRKAAKESLASAHKPGQVILIHTGVAMLISLICVLADHFLAQEISKTGGLSGMSTRAFLSTAQSVLHIFQLTFIPFWQMGYLYYTLRIAKGQPAGAGDLWEGFHRFVPITLLKLLLGILLLLLMFACSYAASFLFMMTPWAAPMLTQMETLLLEGKDYVEVTEYVMSQMQGNMLPLLIIFGVLFCVAGIFLFFFVRQAELWLLDHPNKGAFSALIGSIRCMHRNKLGMLRIDLSFWWFYILEVLVCILSFGNVILRSFGLFMSGDTFLTYLLFFCLYLWAQLMLYWWKRNEVAVTYAHAYLAICPEETTEEQPTTV